MRTSLRGAVHATPGGAVCQDFRHGVPCPRVDHSRRTRSRCGRVARAATAPRAAATGRARTPVIVEPESTVGIEPALAPEQASPVPVLETPEPTAGRLVRLRARLSRSQSLFGKGLLGAALPGPPRRRDVGGDRGEPDQRRRRHGGHHARSSSGFGSGPGCWAPAPPPSCASCSPRSWSPRWSPSVDRTLAATGGNGKPAVLLVVGVNGSGKTTTCGKIARVLVADGHSVVLGAADTFRAAAADQLATWAGRVGAEVVRGPDGRRPGQRGLRRRQAGDRGGRRHRAHRHRGPAAEQDRPHG